MIAVEEAKGTETTLDVVDGMQFDRGFLSPYFVTDPEKLEATTSDYDREKLEERPAKLAGGVAVIRVGAASEAELKSRLAQRRQHSRFSFPSSRLFGIR